jgi:class 3 adenylate cyclase/predicted ATPase
MQQIADWLEKLGLGQYTERFAENEIDVTVLRHLTDQDLREIGVPLGHRRKILAAIREGVGSPAPSEPVGHLEPTSQVSAERRQLTVMFSDLVGSTALSARMDPEDLREVISAYQKCVAETVHRFGGFVAKYMGDGVLIYFGYPEAHEDDAERAVRAGLELVAAVRALKTPASLQARVGIATGLVVVGDLIGSGSAQEQAIVGETPNLAARLQGIAEPDSVIIAETTRRLVGNLFELKDLGAKDLKGIPGPMRAWMALRPAAMESRFEAMHASGLTALVGREEETELLLRRWSRAKSGEGQVVMLSGEAGIGKSRLTAALVESLASEPHTRLRYFCSPQHTDSAFYPIIGQMARAAGIAHDDSAKAKLDKVDALLAQSRTSAEYAALFAEMLSLPNDGRYPSLAALTPEQRRQKTLEALTSQMATLTRQNPVLMIFEDAHWTDPTSLEVFSRFVDQIATLRVLLIVTFRPDFDPPWIGRPHVTALTLNRLAQREVSAIVDRVVGNKLLPANIRQDIVERSDGIPLFIEEMTKAVLEAETGSAAEQTVGAIPFSGRAVPASLHASLMARLDRLGPAKEVAQIGAAIGREFSHALLSAVLRKPSAELGSAFERLIASGLLFRQGALPHATYLFKHALVQDAAYGTLLREQRRALHARIADTLEVQFADIAESQPELLARHCTEAGLIEKAASLWGKAGQRSLARSALVEAAEQLARALAQLGSLPATSVSRREQIKLQVALINALFHVKGYAAPETNAAVEQARLLIEQAKALGEAPEDPLLLFSVLYGLWVANLVAFDRDVCIDLATEFLSLAEREGTAGPLMVGHQMLGISLQTGGDITGGRAHYDQAIALYEPVEHRPLATRFGQDSRVVVLSRRSAALWLLGYPDAAFADAEHALTHAREIGHAASLMYTLGHGLFARYECGNYANATAAVDELIALAEKKSTLFWKGFGLMHQGCLCALNAQPSEAVRLITSGMDTRELTGATLWIPFFSSHLARAYTALGNFEDARRSIREAMMTIKRIKETWCEAEVHRTAGEIMLRAPERDAAKAEEYFNHALTVARRQEAKTWELRAAMSMARLWRDQGKRDKACELLAPVYEWFTEGFDTRDLKEAKTLLEQLASRERSTDEEQGSMS